MALPAHEDHPVQLDQKVTKVRQAAQEMPVQTVKPVQPVKRVDAESELPMADPEKTVPLA